jgi:phosphate transport system ATP-binding protein
MDQMNIKNDTKAEKRVAVEPTIEKAAENSPVVRAIVTEQQTDIEQIIEGTIGEPFAENPKMTTRNLDVFYADKQAIFDVSIDLGKNEVLALIGPSGCGKSTFIRCLNRMNDTIPNQCQRSRDR